MDNQSSFISLSERYPAATMVLKVGGVELLQGYRSKTNELTNVIFSLFDPQWRKSNFIPFVHGQRFLLYRVLFSNAGGITVFFPPSLVGRCSADFFTMWFCCLSLWPSPWWWWKSSSASWQQNSGIGVSLESPPSHWITSSFLSSSSSPSLFSTMMAPLEP